MLQQAHGTCQPNLASGSLARAAACNFWAALVHTCVSCGFFALCKKHMSISACLFIRASSDTGELLAMKDETVGCGLFMRCSRHTPAQSCLWMLGSCLQLLGNSVTCMCCLTFFLHSAKSTCHPQLASSFRPAVTLGNFSQ